MISLHHSACLLVIAVGTACSGSSSPPTSVRTAATVPVRAVHGQPIDLLAVTEDGGAAVTADRQGALRLWPTLDGAREPLVIAGVEARALAILRDGQDFAIAELDHAHHVEIRRWSSRGEPGARRQLERPARLLVATRASFLVVTEDHAVDVHDARGELRAHLVAEPGTRIESLAVRGERALAVIASRDRVHGRWIDLATNAWGRSTPTLAIAATPVVLSPDGHTLAGLDAKTALPLVLEVATGKVTRSPACDTRPAPSATDPLTATLPIGFHDARTLVCGNVAGLLWWSLDRASRTPIPTFAITAAIAFTPERAIVAHDTQLALVDLTGTKYLGYETSEFPHVRFTPRGVLVGRGDQRATLLDDDFQSRLEIALPPIAGTWYDIVPLDDRYLLTLSSNGEVDGAHAKRVAIYDLETRALGPLLPFEGPEDVLAYEPSTGLVILAEGGARTVRRIDPVTRGFGAPIPLDASLAYLVNPALADGVIALAVTTGEGSFQITELRSSGEPGERLHRGRSFRVPGEFRAVDRAGRLYMTTRYAEGGDVVVFEHGAPTVTLAGIATHLIRPSSDGTQIATFGDQRVALYGADGTERWATAAVDARDLGWVGEALVAQFPLSFARFAPGTGAFAARRCGWGFGLSGTPRSTVPSNGLVCDVAP